MSDITIDVSEIHKLASMLDNAADRIDTDVGDEVQQVAQRVAAEARATAGSYPHGTGALAAAVEVHGSGLESFIGADVREAWFLEVGSPNTGAPRPWLTEPSERGLRDLEKKLDKTIDPFR